MCSLLTCVDLCLSLFHISVSSRTEGPPDQSKKALKKQQKEAEKAAKKAAYRQQNQAQQQQQQQEESGDDVSLGHYGNLPIIQSTEKPNRQLLDVKQLTPAFADQKVWVRARLQTSRSKGKQCFFVLRQRYWTVQALVAVGQDVSKQMVKFTAGINKESIVDIEAYVRTVPQKVEACTQQDVELHVLQVWVVSTAAPQLPMLVEDAARPETDVTVSFCRLSSCFLFFLTLFPFSSLSHSFLMSSLPPDFLSFCFLFPLFLFLFPLCLSICFLPPLSTSFFLPFHSTCSYYPFFLSVHFFYPSLSLSLT
ncbi:DARS [Acanthosepion pharaonis]|uniref:DARS n=1 Tax=Acanthosepion pharaonis TaxID=158019 RepID=A0A812BUN6_ACAPH|nr:DARS [Sepia pharaonis]